MSRGAHARQLTRRRLHRGVGRHVKSPHGSSATRKRSDCDVNSETAPNCLSRDERSKPQPMIQGVARCRARFNGQCFARSFARTTSSRRGRRPSPPRRVGMPIADRAASFVPLTDHSDQTKFRRWVTVNVQQVRSAAVGSIAETASISPAGLGGKVMKAHDGASTAFARAAAPPKLWQRRTTGPTSADGCYEEDATRSVGIASRNSWRVPLRTRELDSGQPERRRRPQAFEPSQETGRIEPVARTNMRDDAGTCEPSLSPSRSTLSITLRDIVRILPAEAGSHDQKNARV